MCRPNFIMYKDHVNSYSSVHSSQSIISLYYTDGITGMDCGLLIFFCLFHVLINVYRICVLNHSVPTDSAYFMPPYALLIYYAFKLGRNGVLFSGFKWGVSHLPQIKSASLFYPMNVFWILLSCVCWLKKKCRVSPFISDYMLLLFSHRFFAFYFIGFRVISCHFIAFNRITLPCSFNYEFQFSFFFFHPDGDNKYIFWVLNKIAINTIADGSHNCSCLLVSECEEVTFFNILDFCCC